MFFSEDPHHYQKVHVRLGSSAFGNQHDRKAVFGHANNFIGSSEVFTLALMALRRCEKIDERSLTVAVLSRMVRTCSRLQNHARKQVVGLPIFHSFSPFRYLNDRHAGWPKAVAELRANLDFAAYRPDRIRILRAVFIGDQSRMNRGRRG